MASDDFSLLRLALTNETVKAFASSQPAAEQSDNMSATAAGRAADQPSMDIGPDILEGLEIALDKQMEYRGHLLSLSAPVNTIHKFIVNPESPATIQVAKELKPLLRQILSIQVAFDNLENSDRSMEALTFTRHAIRTIRGEAILTDMEATSGAGEEDPSVPAADGQENQEMELDIPLLRRQINEEYSYMVQHPLKDLQSLNKLICKLATDGKTKTGHELRHLGFEDVYKGWSAAFATAWVGLGGSPLGAW